MSKPVAEKKQSDLLIYQVEDGRTRVEVRVDASTVWLTQAAMAELFQTTKQNISLHLRNILAEKELREVSVVKEYLTTDPSHSQRLRSLRLHRLDNRKGCHGCV